MTVGVTRQNWCTVVLTSLDGLDLKQSKRLLLVATGYAENKNMGWKNEEKSTVGTHWGTGPSLVEIIPATLRIPGTRLSAYVLDEHGQRATPLATRQTDNTVELRLGNPHRTLWYEFTRP